MERGALRSAHKIERHRPARSHQHPCGRVHFTVLIRCMGWRADVGWRRGIIFLDLPYCTFLREGCHYVTLTVG
jgi:hypothetical protein